MITINEQMFNKIVHDFPKLITELEKLKCTNKKCKINIISKLEKTRELFLEAIEE